MFSLVNGPNPFSRVTKKCKPKKRWKKAKDKKCHHRHDTEITGHTEPHSNIIDTTECFDSRYLHKKLSQDGNTTLILKLSHGYSKVSLTCMCALASDAYCTVAVVVLRTSLEVGSGSGSTNDGPHKGHSKVQRPCRCLVK